MKNLSNGISLTNYSNQPIKIPSSSYINGLKQVTSLTRSGSDPMLRLFTGFLILDPVKTPVKTAASKFHFHRFFHRF